MVLPGNAVIREAITEESVLDGWASEQLGNHPNMEKQVEVELNRGREVKLALRILAIMGVRVRVLLADLAEEEEDLKITVLLEVVEDTLEVSINYKFKGFVKF